MAIELFAHNQKAYESALQMLEDEHKTAVIHPTGTGKSFIGFQFVDEHPGWTICWISPSDYIFQTQLENVSKVKKDISFANLCFLTYAKLMNMSLEELDALQPDLIILDEFHRAGAAEWSKGVNRLIELYPEAMLLGLSATHIRYLDNQRDMADELFDGHIASQMTLGEAIVRGILKAPKYVISLYAYEQSFSRIESRVRNMRKGRQKEQAQLILERLKRALERSQGLDEIFRQHMEKRSGRYIVFCSGHVHMQEMISQSADWFSGVDPDLHVYQAYSDDPLTSKAFREFKADHSDHLKLLYCIDMLNEGVHVDDLDGVILLRPTVSPIVYKQQIGRAMSASSHQVPIIFDIVNNFDSLTSIDAIQDEMDLAVNYYRMMGIEDAIQVERFAVQDEVRDCMEIFEQLNETLSASWDQMYAQAKDYYDTHGDLMVPKAYVSEDGSHLGQWIQTQRQIRRQRRYGSLSAERIALLDQIGMAWENHSDMLWERYMQALRHYQERFHHIDVPADYVNEDGLHLGNWVSRLRVFYSSAIRQDYLSEARIQQLNELGMIWDHHDALWERNYRSAKAFYERHGHLRIPEDYRDEEGVRIGTWIRNMRSRYRQSDGASLSQEQKRRMEAIGMRFASRSDVEWQNGYDHAKAYHDQHHDLCVPIAYRCADGFALGKWLARHRPNARGKTEIRVDDQRRKLLDQIGMIWESGDAESTYLQAAQAYYAEHGDLALYGEGHYHGLYLGTWLSRKRKLYHEKKLPAQLQETLNAMNMDWRTSFERKWDEQAERTKAFVDAHGHLPDETEDKALALWCRRQKARKPGELTARQIEQLAALGISGHRRESWNDYWQEARAFVQAHGHLHVPLSYVSEQGLKLGEWICKQRQAYHNGKLSEKRIAQLKEVHMCWEDPISRTWEEGYAYARQYHAKQHDLLVPSSYRTADGYPLGEWLSKQRAHYRNNMLRPSQISRLDELGMVWSDNEVKWNQNYQKACDYYRENGNLKVPTTYRTEDGTQLGSWIRTQKKAYREAKNYPKERIHKLEALGIEW